MLCACGNEDARITENSVSELEKSDVSEETSSEEDAVIEEAEPEPEPIPGNPYLSITYRRGKYPVKRAIYTYDINSRELKEECVLPMNVYKNDSAVFCRENGKVYYSALADSKNYAAGDSIWTYDIKTGEQIKIEDENRVNYGFSIVEGNRLLVRVLTDEESISAAFLDEESGTYSYMPETDVRPIHILSINYNYKTGEYACVYCDSEELRSRDYQEGKTEMTRYVAIASEDLVIDTEKSFAYTAKFTEFNLDEAIQISENELLVMVRKENDYSDTKYYSLVFEEGEAVFTKVENPYPYEEYLHGLCTADGGKNFYFYIHDEDEKGNPAGLYSYNTETTELTPILLNDPEEDNGGWIEFSLIGER